MTTQNTTKKGAEQASDVKKKSKGKKKAAPKLTLALPERPLGRGRTHRVQVATPPGMKRLERGLTMRKLEHEVGLMFGDLCESVQATHHTHWWRTTKEGKRQLVYRAALLVVSVPKGKTTAKALSQLRAHVEGIYFQVKSAEVNIESEGQDHYVLISDEAGTLPVFVAIEDWIRLAYSWGVDVANDIFRYSPKGKAKALAIKAEMDKAKAEMVKA